MSTTIHNLASDGTDTARGSASAANNGTVETGLSLVEGFLALAEESDISVTRSSVSQGTVTVNVVAAGVASGSAKTFYWKAWSIKKV